MCCDVPNEENEQPFLATSLCFSQFAIHRNSSTTSCLKWIKNKLLQSKGFNNQPWSIPSLCLQNIPLAQHQKQTTCSVPMAKGEKKWLHKTRKLGRSPATSEEFAEFLRGESGTLDLVTWYAIHNRSEYHPKEFAHVKEATTKKNFTTTQYSFSLVVHVISKNQPKKPNSLPLEKLEKIHPSSYSPFLSSQVTHWMLVGV